MSRYLDWLHQAQNDLAWAKHSQAGGFYAHLGPLPGCLAGRRAL